MADKNKWVVISSRLYRLDPAGKGDPRRQVPHDRGTVLTDLSDAEVDHFVAAEGIAPYGSDAAKAAMAGPAWPVHPSAGEAPSGPAIADERAAAAVDYAPTPAPTSVVSISDGPDFDDAADGSEVVKRPPKSGSADAWRTYAVESGQLTEDEAAATSRDKLRETLT